MRDARYGMGESCGGDASRIPHLASRVLDPAAVPRLRVSLTTTPASAPAAPPAACRPPPRDRKSTRLNSSHDQISYAVFCLKKKKTEQIYRTGSDNIYQL